MLVSLKLHKIVTHLTQTVRIKRAFAPAKHTRRKTEKKKQ